MRYSLLSRFQGMLLGAAIGEELGCYRAAHDSPNAVRPQSLTPALPYLSKWNPGTQLEQSFQPISKTIYGHTALGWTKTLLDQGGWKGFESGLTTDFQLDSNSLHQPGDISFRNGAELAIAALPLMLFFHDNEIRLTQVLEDVVTRLKMPRSTLAELTVIHRTIAQILTEQFTPDRLVPDLIEQLQNSDRLSQNDSTGLVASLQMVQTLSQQGASLDTAVRQLVVSKEEPSSVEIISLVLYCFLSTPDNVRLTLLRAAHLSVMPQVLCGLAGALSGAYNSVTGLPLHWHWEAEANSPMRAWGVTSATLKHLATQLLAVWSGVYDLNSLPDLSLAVAPPGVIRLR